MLRKRKQAPLIHPVAVPVSVARMTQTHLACGSTESVCYIYSANTFVDSELGVGQVVCSVLLLPEVLCKHRRLLLLSFRSSFLSHNCATLKESELVLTQCSWALATYPLKYVPVTSPSKFQHPTIVLLQHGQPVVAGFDALSAHRPSMSRFRLYLQSQPSPRSCSHCL